MILVIVGTHFKGFERLVQHADDIAATMDEEFVMQIGASRLIPRHSKFFRATPHEKLLSLIQEARVVVCHAGAGCILDCINAGKVPIVVPRLKKYGEARDDHQLELTGLLEKQGKIVAVRDPELLAQAIQNYGKITSAKENDDISLTNRQEEDRQNLVTSLRKYLVWLSDSVDAKKDKE